MVPENLTMTERSRDKWTAFLLSLAVPGAGQLWARSGWCWLWFTAAALLTALPFWIDPANGSASAGIRFVALAVLGLLSAEHAKRCLEPVRRRTATPLVTSHVS